MHKGEDVVAGIRTPQPISRLEEDLPQCYKEFMDIANKLGNFLRDMQDVWNYHRTRKAIFLTDKKW